MFPPFENLSYEQKSVTSLRFDTNNLVLGAPGTGKTIVAMHRINALYEEGYKNLIMLVYNRPLMHYVEAVKKEMGWSDRFEIYTINDWVYYKLYSGSIDKPASGGIKNKPVPNVDGEENKFKINWEVVNKDFENVEKIYSHIVVDEGQDISIDFYKLIVKLSSYVTVFTDPNQSLFNNSITIPEILNILKKESYYTLTLNYRNSKKIVDFTRKYATDKSICAESYKEGEDLEIIKHSDKREELLASILNIVKKYDINKEIGIIVPSEHDKSEEEKRELSNTIYDYLSEKLPINYKVSVYWNEVVDKNDRDNVDFSEKSIKIFNYFTVRGIDFDVVILLDNLTSKINDDMDIEELNKYKNRLYVATTRAKMILYIIPLNDEDCVYDENDDNLLDYSKYTPIKNLSGMDCYNKSIECYKNKQYEEAMYYLHYAISVVGLDDNEEILSDAMKKMAFLCDKFNKNDFGVGIISNYAEKNKIYDDKKLIYFYQSCFLGSYNSKYSYVNPDRFFKNLVKLENIDDKEALLNKYYSKYISNCNNKNELPKLDFANQYIDKYNLSSYNAYKHYEKVAKEIHEEAQRQEEQQTDEITDYDLWNEISEIKGHDLLDGSYILVIAASKIPINTYLKKAAIYKYIEKDFRFYLEYDKMPNINFNELIKPYQDNPIVIILGSMPHSIKEKGSFSSLYAKLQNDPIGYPKIFTTGFKKELSVSAFGNALKDADYYIRRSIYDEKAVF